MAEMTAGTGTLFMDPDPEAARGFFRKKKGALVDKVTSVSAAVAALIHNGDYVASGGFGTNRISTAVLHEILRQKKRNLGFAGFTTTHAFQIVAAGNLRGEKLLARVDASYIVGLEARGLSPHARRVMEGGGVDVCDWSNYAMATRLKAAAMGVPFLPVRSLLGTDTFARSAARLIDCPFTGRKLAAVPALYPDVAFIHVHECDCYGNARIRGITAGDADLARAAKRLIITTERLVANREIRSAPNQTVIPSFCVDAVCEVTGGSYPGNMGGEYFSDEVHLAAWLEAEKSEESLEAFLQQHIYGVPDFQGYLQICGGSARLRELREMELFSREEANRG